MAEFPEEYVFALTRALAQAKVLPSATDDITIRVLRDKPADIVGYLQSLQAVLPSYFEKAPTAAPVEPTPDEPGYNAWFLRNAERIAGGPTLQTATGAKGELATGGGKQAPKVLKRSDPGFNKAFVTYAAEIASGQCTVE